VAWDHGPIARSPTPDPALAVVLRRIREERGLTQEGLAFRAGITLGSYAQIELGNSAPAWSTVRRIAEALDVPLVELVAAVEAET
jgi:transcriptional regulator with XRE-family HTH domain